MKRALVFLLLLSGCARSTEKYEGSSSYKLGRKAFQAGVPITANPFANQWISGSYDWQEGWLDEKLKESDK